jgi:hypothetical protein
VSKLVCVFNASIEFVEADNAFEEIVAEEDVTFVDLLDLLLALLVVFLLLALLVG